MDKELREKLKIVILTEALEDIANWNDDLEYDFEDPGYRALQALKEFNKLNDR